MLPGVSRMGLIVPLGGTTQFFRRDALERKLRAAIAQGAERAITGAMRDARLNPEDVGYINAHGTGTAANDKTECAAVAHAFGHHADRLMMSSTKAMHGHIIGGTGAVELLACIMALRDGVIAPTIGYQEADPECALDTLSGAAGRRVGAARRLLAVLREP